LLNQLLIILTSLRQYSTKAASSFSEAENYRKLANLSEEQATSFNSNATQSFKTWLTEQPSPDGRGSLGLHQIESMMQNDPIIAQSYAEQFVREQLPDFMQQFSSAHDVNPERIKQAHTNFEQRVDSTVVEQAQVENEAQVQAARDEIQWREVDTSIDHDVQSVINRYEDNLEEKRVAIKQTRDSFKRPPGFEEKE